MSVHLFTRLSEATIAMLLYYQNYGYTVRTRLLLVKKSGSSHFSHNFIHYLEDNLKPRCSLHDPLFVHCDLKGIVTWVVRVSTEKDHLVCLLCFVLQPLLDIVEEK